jgi:hypothetical protein
MYSLEGIWTKEWRHCVRRARKYSEFSSEKEAPAVLEPVGFKQGTLTPRIQPSPTPHIHAFNMNMEVMRMQTLADAEQSDVLHTDMPV